MSNTIIQFDLFKYSESQYGIDPNSFYMFGFCKLPLLDDFLRDNNESLTDIWGNDQSQFQTVTLEIWEDSDDDHTWLDWKRLPDDYEVKLP